MSPLSPLIVTNAARPAVRVAGASRGEPPAPVAREARRDQDQAIDIHRFRIWKTADDRTGEADRQLFPASMGLRWEARQERNRLHGFMVRSHRGHRRTAANS